jgi:hypothetical protein
MKYLRIVYTMEEQFSFSFHTTHILNRVRETTDLIEVIYNQRYYTSGTKRDAYTEVIRSELYRLIKQIDEFKMAVCERLGDCEGEAIMNMSRFPTVKGEKSADE